MTLHAGLWTACPFSREKRTRPSTLIYPAHCGVVLAQHDSPFPSRFTKWRTPTGCRPLRDGARELADLRPAVGRVNQCHMRERTGVNLLRRAIQTGNVVWPVACASWGAANRARLARGLCRPPWSWLPYMRRGVSRPLSYQGGAPYRGSPERALNGFFTGLWAGSSTSITADIPVQWQISIRAAHCGDSRQPGSAEKRGRGTPMKLIAHEAGNSNNPPQPVVGRANRSHQQNHDGDLWVPMQPG